MKHCNQIAVGDGSIHPACTPLADIRLQSWTGAEPYVICVQFSVVYRCCRRMEPLSTCRTSAGGVHATHVAHTIFFLSLYIYVSLTLSLDLLRLLCRSLRHWWCLCSTIITSNQVCNQRSHQSNTSKDVGVVICIQYIYMVPTIGHTYEQARIIFFLIYNTWVLNLHSSTDRKYIRHTYVVFGSSTKV
jgi:hypothetical protein